MQNIYKTNSTYLIINIFYIVTVLRFETKFVILRNINYKILASICSFEFLTKFTKWIYVNGILWSAIIVCMWQDIIWLSVGKAGNHGT